MPNNILCKIIVFRQNFNQWQQVPIQCMLSGKQRFVGKKLFWHQNSGACNIGAPCRHGRRVIPAIRDVPGFTNCINLRYARSRFLSITERPRAQGQGRAECHGCSRDGPAETYPGTPGFLKSLFCPITLRLMRPQFHFRAKFFQSLVAR